MPTHHGAPGVTRRIRTTGRILPALALAAFAVQWLAPYPGWTMLAVALGGACILGWLWARSLAGGLNIERALRYGWTQVGDLIEERFRVEQTGWLPALWLELRDESNLPGYDASRATGIGSQAANTWVTSGICTRRGLYRLGPTTVRCADPLGLFIVTVHNPATETLVVMPPVLPLPTIAVAPGGRAGEGRRLRDGAERTVSAARVREYRYGDDARWVHWPTSARRDELFVRQFDSTPAGDWWIMLDSAAGVQDGTGADSTLELGIVLAASLADRGIREGKSVGLVADGSPALFLPPRGGEQHRWAILRGLSTLALGSTSLGDALARLRPAFGRAASVVVITPDDPAHWLPALLPLVQRGTVPTVLLIEAADGLPAAQKRGEWLASLGIHHHVVPRSLFEMSAANIGRAGHWEWRVTGTGKAVAVLAPPDSEWKSLQVRG